MITRKWLTGCDDDGDKGSWKIHEIRWAKREESDSQSLGGNTDAKQTWRPSCQTRERLLYYISKSRSSARLCHGGDKARGRDGGGGGYRCDGGGDKTLPDGKYQALFCWIYIWWDIFPLFCHFRGTFFENVFIEVKQDKS